MPRAIRPRYRADLSLVGTAVVAAACLTVGLLVPRPVHAQAADLSRATCGQLLDLPRQDQGQVILWLHGYYAGAAQRALLDRDRIEAAVRDMLATCGRDRTLTLIGPDVRAILLGDPAPRPPAQAPQTQVVPNETIDPGPAPRPTPRPTSRP